MNYLYTINLYTIRSFDKLTLAYRWPGPCTLNLYSRKLHVVNNLILILWIVNICEKAITRYPFQIWMGMRMGNGNWNSFYRETTNFLDYEIIWMFHRNISYNSYSRITCTQTTINPNQAFNFPFVKWTAVVQPKKSERRDVCSGGLTLSNLIFIIYSTENFIHGAIEWYQNDSQKPKVSKLLSQEWNYSTHDKSNSTEFQLKRNGKQKTF